LTTTYTQQKLEQQQQQQHKGLGTTAPIQVILTAVLSLFSVSAGKKQGLYLKRKLM